VARKTVPVATIVEKANFFLANSKDEQKCARESVANFVEVLLLSVDSYAGFNYLPAAQVDYAHIERTRQFKARDESRRRYHLHRKVA
jgi:hypothetical protein